MLLFHQPTQSLSRTLTHELTRAGARMSHNDAQFGNPSRLPVHRVCSPSAHRNVGMSENASLYEVAVFLYAAGLPWTETLWLRRRLESRTISRQLFPLVCSFWFCFGGIALLVWSAREEKRRSKLSWKGYNDQKAAEVSCLFNELALDYRLSQTVGQNTRHCLNKNKRWLR